MNAIALGVLYGWPFAIVLVFCSCSPRRAVIISAIAGWLFLPEATIEISGFPDYTKITATMIGLIAGVMIVDGRRFMLIRWRLWDLPVLVWCCSPFITSIVNGLGPWDGASSVMTQAITWGIPYVIGRAVFQSPSDLRELAMGIFIGGLVYAPLCIWEIKMSPNLHYHLYGFRSSPFLTHIRFDGYRPSVFLHSGLAVGLWMAAASLCGLVMLTSKSQRTFMGVPSVLFVCGLVIVTIDRKSVV